MGCEASKPPPVRTCVHNYPGSQGPPKEEGADQGISDTTHSAQAPTTNEDGEEHIDHPVPHKPVIITAEGEVFNKPSEDCDVILDDEESVTGAEPALELTAKEINKQQSAFGREEQTLQARQSEHVVPSIRRPEVASGKLWSDPDYPQGVAMKGIRDFVQWKRPKTFMKKPCLYSDGTCRYDIEQGDVGTCWFLAVLQSLADQPEYLRNIIPEGSYRIGTPEYDGIFHCRFWRFGDWVDVYIDDNIPVMDGKPFGARSKTDPNELWVTLIEKALSKFIGSYQRCTGRPLNAFVYLTAGTGECLHLDEIKPKDFYMKAKNSLACGSIVTADIVSGKDQMGLIGNHGYAITGICKVVYRSKYTSLIRIRNPWGEREGEWTGAWSDRSAEWKQLSPKDKAAVQHTARGDGEFWMNLTDFFRYFNLVDVCNYTPDVDRDGNTDEMSKSWAIFGEWKGNSAASGKLMNRMKNPKFEFEIPQQGVPKDGTPVVIQLIQAPKRQKNDSFLSLRASLFKVEAVFGEKGSEHRLIYQLTIPTTYTWGEPLTYRYPTLAPGKYLVVPYYGEDPGIETEFLLRIFSQITLQCREIKDCSGYFYSYWDNTLFEYEGKIQTTGEVETRHGAWVSGQNAGGQLGSVTAWRNPQYKIHIKDPGQLIEQPCRISLCQDMSTLWLCIGFRIFKIPDNDKAPTPMDGDWMLQNSDKCPVNTDGGQYKLMTSMDVTADYMLMPGDYFLVVYTLQPDQEASYILQIATKYETDMREYHVADIPN